TTRSPNRSHSLPAPDDPSENSRPLSVGGFLTNRATRSLIVLKLSNPGRSAAIRFVDSDVLSRFCDPRVNRISLSDFCQRRLIAAPSVYEFLRVSELPIFLVHFLPGGGGKLRVTGCGTSRGPMAGLAVDGCPLGISHIGSDTPKRVFELNN